MLKEKIMQKRQLLINAIFSITQVVVTSGVLFILYRFLLNSIGVEQLGIWSLVLATTSVSQIANLGLSGSVVKFVAKYIARGEAEKASALIQTAALSIGIFVALVLIVVFPVAVWVLELIIPAKSYVLALSILPLALFAVWLMMITSIFQAGLDGYQRFDLRSLLLMGGAVLNLVLCFILVPTYGLLGVAYARIIQYLTVLPCSMLLLKRCLPSFPVVSYRWDKDLFKEIIGYGTKFQVIIVIRMLYDPVTKVLLGNFGGLSTIGYYEMASRMIQQFRALIVSANQVLVPAIANLQEKTPENIYSVYRNSYQLLFYLALPLFSLIIVSMPILSDVWIGHYERTFVIFGILLSIGWFLNTLSGPAYFANLGTGELRWNMLGHLTIGLLNAILGFLLGTFFHGIGVVAAWIFSLALGSSIIYVSYHIRHKIPLIELFSKSSRAIIAVCLVGVLSALLIHYKLNNAFNTIALNSAILFAFSIIVFIPLWVHPTRKRLMVWVINELLSRSSGAQ